MKKLPNQFCLFIILMICQAYHLSAQEKDKDSDSDNEKEYKIRDKAKDSISIDVLGKKIRGFYTGQYIKRLNGEKGVHPHAKGKLKFIYENDSAFYEGDFFEGKLTGKGYLETNQFGYLGSLVDGNFSGEGELNYKSQQSKIESVKGMFKEGKANGKTEIAYRSGNIYSGYVVMDNYEGYGRMDYRDGSIDRGNKGNKILPHPYFEGNWVNNKQNGKGIFYFENGEILDGEWDGLNFTGKGKLTLFNGAIYDGNWLNGSFVGFGKYIWENGDYYNGEWLNSNQNGKGVLYLKNRNEYWNCNWKDNFPVDSGTVSSELNGIKTSYKGGVGGVRTKNGRSYFYEGFGNLYVIFPSEDTLMKNDSSYIGFFHNGMPHGKGKCERNQYDFGLNEWSYDGDWLNGQRHGKGVFNSTSGVMSENYQGEWLNNTKNGKGELLVKDEYGIATFVGIWKDDQLSGYAELTQENMKPETEKTEITTYKGNFEKSLKNGQGTEASSEGTYAGNWLNNAKNGQGKMVYKNGKIYEGEWVKDQPNGQGTLTLANKTTQTGKFINGEYQKPFVCKEVKIGEQVWMAENLNVDKFRNGDPIPEAKTNEEWLRAGENKQPAWCYYDNDSKNGAKYHKLYNWYAVSDSRGLAPTGWHIPSEAEWNQLTANLGGVYEAGAKMKNISGWYENANGNNSSGFSGLPGGNRSYDGSLMSIGKYGGWWSSSERTPKNAGVRNLTYFDGFINISEDSKKGGLSVRCVKD